MGRSRLNQWETLLACLLLVLSGSITSRKTVDQLFDAVGPPYQDWGGRVDFDFDSDLGYSLRLQLDGKPNIADAGVVYETRSLRR